MKIVVNDQLKDAIEWTCRYANEYKVDIDIHIDADGEVSIGVCPTYRDRAEQTENSSEKPNNCETQTYVINPQDPTNDDKCFECDDFFTCGGQCNKIEDEPQTDECAKEYEKLGLRKLKELRKDEPQTVTQTETQNSNLTFEKRTMRDCYNCKRYETEGECIECYYEPKTEPQADCPWK